MKLRVLTYNIHRAIGLDRRFAPDRIIEILSEHNADIVLLQEVDENVPRSNHLQLAKELAQALDYPYFAMGHNVELRKGSYGNATLSRFPIIDERNIDLSVGIKKRRGCQHTRLDLGEISGSPYTLEVFNLHLGLSALERRMQARILAQSEEFISLGVNTNSILAGDFNDWRSLLRKFYVNGIGCNCATDVLTQSSKKKAIKTFPSFSPIGALDRIYYRGKLEVEAVNRSNLKLAKFASDHLPVFADFLLK